MPVCVTARCVPSRRQASRRETRQRNGKLHADSRAAAGGCPCPKHCHLREAMVAWGRIGTSVRGTTTAIFGWPCDPQLAKARRESPRVSLCPVVHVRGRGELWRIYAHKRETRRNEGSLDHTNGRARAHSVEGLTTRRALGAGVRCGKSGLLCQLYLPRSLSPRKVPGPAQPRPGCKRDLDRSSRSPPSPIPPRDLAASAHVRTG